MAPVRKTDRGRDRDLYLKVAVGVGVGAEVEVEAVGIEAGAEALPRCAMIALHEAPKFVLVPFPIYSPFYELLADVFFFSFLFFASRLL